MDSFTEIQVDLAHVPTQSTAIVRLHRPKVLNAISKTMLEELVSALALCVRVCQWCLASRLARQ